MFDPTKLKPEFTKFRAVPSGPVSITAPPVAGTTRSYWLPFVNVPEICTESGPPSYVLMKP